MVDSGANNNKMFLCISDLSIFVLFETTIIGLKQKSTLQLANTVERNNQFVGSATHCIIMSILSCNRRSSSKVRLSIRDTNSGSTMPPIAGWMHITPSANGILRLALLPSTLEYTYKNELKMIQ